MKQKKVLKLSLALSIGLFGLALGSIESHATDVNTEVQKVTNHKLGGLEHEQFSLKKNGQGLKKNTTKKVFKKHWNKKHNHSLPSKIDPRNNTTPVRDQYEQSICWSYGGNDLLSIAKHKQLHQKGYDVYSPNYTNYLTAWDAFYGHKNYWLPGIVADGLYNENGAIWRGLDQGGFTNIPATMAMLGKNPALESNFASVDENGHGTQELDYQPITPSDFKAIQEDNSFEVTDIEQPDGVVAPYMSLGEDAIQEKINTLKTLVATNGAIGFSYNAYLVMDQLVSEKPVFNTETKALYLPYDHDSEYIAKTASGKEYTFNAFGANHANLIVGYDDHYSKENFAKGTQPSQDGAFLVKNSWGTEFGDNGYFWVSYQDYFVLGDEDGTSVTVQPKKANETVHSAAKSAQDLCLLPFNADFNNQNYQTIVFSNSYASSTDATLDAVTVDAGSNNIDYDVYFIPNEAPIENGIKTTSSIEEMGGVKVASGKEEISGLHKVAIKPQKLAKGQDYSIVVKEHPEVSTEGLYFWVEDIAAFKDIKNCEGTMYKDWYKLPTTPSYVGYVENDNQISWTDAREHGFATYINAYTVAK